MCSETQDTRICTKCSVERPATDEFFYVRWNTKHHKHFMDGRCKDCTKARLRDEALIRKYGMTSIEVENMVEKQQHRCFICERKFNSKDKLTKPNVDHCHKSGKIRGILCGKCNMALGLFRDNPLVLQRAAKYLCDDIV